MRVVVGISGSTGTIYGIRLLEVLRRVPDVETHLVISQAGRRTLVEETDYTLRQVEALATHSYDDRDIGAALASGSFRTAGMVIAPCSIKTVSALANCYASTLIARAGDVTLKEGRPLVVAVRETPLHVGHLRQLLALAEMGAVILPPMPAFYPRPKSLDDIVNHTVGRILDRFGIDHGLVAEWMGTGRARRRETAASAAAGTQPPPSSPQAGAGGPAGRSRTPRAARARSGQPGRATTR